MFGSLIKFLSNSFKRDSVEVYPDTLVSSRATLNELLPTWLRPETKTDLNLVLPIFESTFLEIQESLQDAKIDFEIAPPDIPIDYFSRRFKISATSPKRSEKSPVNGFPKMAPTVLGLAAQICQPISFDANGNRIEPKVAEQPKEGWNQLPHISVIIPEFHPYYGANDGTVDSLRKYRMKVDLGFFIAIDDPIVRHWVDQRVVDLLKDMGLDSEQVTSSHFFFRHLRKQMKKHWTPQIAGLSCSSQEEWFEWWKKTEP